MTEERHNERVQIAKALMAEIFTDKPQLQTEPSTHTTRRRDAALRESHTTTDRLESTGLSSRQDKPQGDHHMQKGRYMFIDSGAYPNTSTSHRRENVGRADSRAYGLSQRGYNSKQREDIGRGTKGMQSQGYGSRSRGRREEYNEVTREPDDEMMLDGISEITETPPDESKNNTDQMRSYKPKPYDQVVRVQRPEVTRTQQVTPRRQKTYTEMLQEMKGDGINQRSLSQSLKAKQRLYGEFTKRSTVPIKRNQHAYIMYPEMKQNKRENVSDRLFSVVCSLKPQLIRRKNLHT